MQRDELQSVAIHDYFYKDLRSNKIEAQSDERYTHLRYNLLGKVKPDEASTRDTIYLFHRERILSERYAALKSKSVQRYVRFNIFKVF